MARCRALAEVGRRRFLTGSGLAAAGAVVAGARGRPAAAAGPAAARITYPSSRLGNLRDLKPNEPLEVAYPDADAPGVIVKLGRRVLGGAGPDGDVVGFSTICPHKGYPLRYSVEDRSFDCSGHYSRFDAESGGQQIWGHATQNLPQYLLRVDDAGDIHAEGVDELLYGRIANVLA